MKNLYYRSTLGRENHLKSIILGTFFAISSYPRLLLEVFIREDFGCRYVRQSSVWTLGILLIVFPYYKPIMVSLFHSYSVPILPPTNYYAWEMFALLFLWVGVKRARQADFNKNSYQIFSKNRGKPTGFYASTILPMFTIRKENKIRYQEIFIEPLVFLLPGILLFFLGQKLGILLIVCSVISSIAAKAAWDAGDNFVMDKIDELICNEYFQKDFLEGKADNGIDFTFRGHVPKLMKFREAVSSSAVGDKEKDVIE